MGYERFDCSDKCGVNGRTMVMMRCKEKENRKRVKRREIHAFQRSQGFRANVDDDFFTLALSVDTSAGNVWKDQGSRSVARLAFEVPVLVFEADTVEPTAAKDVERNGFPIDAVPKLPKMSLSGTSGAHDASSWPLNERVGPAV